MDSDAEAPLAAETDEEHLERLVAEIAGRLDRLEAENAALRGVIRAVVSHKKGALRIPEVRVS